MVSRHIKIIIMIYWIYLKQNKSAKLFNLSLKIFHSFEFSFICSWFILLLLSKGHAVIRCPTFLDSISHLLAFQTSFCSNAVDIQLPGAILPPYGLECGSYDRLSPVLPTDLPASCVFPAFCLPRPPRLASPVSHASLTKFSRLCSFPSVCVHCLTSSLQALIPSVLSKLFPPALVLFSPLFTPTPPMWILFTHI